MDQVSLPMRIALGAVLVFAALWFVALRPKPVEEVAADPVPAAETPAATPAQSSSGTSGSAATAEPAAEPSAAKTDDATSSSPAKNASENATGGAGAARVLSDLDAGRTVVLLVWDGKSADDRSVRRAVSRVDRHGGKVRAHVVKVSKLSSYEAITKGVPITESPTVLVIDKQRQARVISGLTVKGEIDDAVDRALKVK